MELMTISAGQPLTMSSREIAELCEKRHTHVMDDCRKLHAFYARKYSAEKTAELIKSGTYHDSTGRELPCFHLNQQASLDLVTGYSLEHRHAVNQRWMELERKVQQPDPIQVLNDPAAMRGLLLTYSERVLRQEATITAMQPKVAALDRIATPSEGSFCIREAAKILQVKERRLYQVLIENQWIYRHPLGKAWLAYAPILQKGFMEHKLSNGDKQDGGQWQSTQARITVRGVAKLAMILGISVANDGDLYSEVRA